MSERSKSPSINETNRHYTMNTVWPEWKDSDLDNEKWGTPANGLFLDMEPVILPQSLQPYCWIRAKDLECVTDSLTVFASTDKYPDLISNNKHLLHSEFMRLFISALVNLQYCGRDGLEISGGDTNFAWTSRHEPWHGWMHVYSLNKAGENVQHRPTINPNGKYIVRLHHVGCWRRIMVDDTIPVDQNDTPLLPRTSHKTELWSMLLAKALLKIASLTWTDRREIIDFHFVSCLTGWTCLTLNIAHLSWQDKWDFLTKYSDHFTWTPQTVESHVAESSESVTINNTAKPNETLRLLAQAGKPRPITLFLQLRDMRELENNAVPGLSPCWDHVIYVAQSRDIPLDPKDVKPPLERWKLQCWLKWAVSRGIIDPADYFVPIRYLRVISPLRKRNESLTCVHDDIKNKSVCCNEIKLPDKIQSNAKSLSAENLPLGTTTNEETDDISHWVDFNKIAPYVTEVHLFYKSEYFQYSVRVANKTINLNNNDHKVTTANEIRAENGDNFDKPYNVQNLRCKPLYLFCDSLETKFFLIELCAAPNKKNYLILERYNWFFGTNRSDQAVTICTTGTKSTVVEMEAGRQLLRIDGSPEFTLAIVFSDTAFHLGDQATVQQLMSTESDRTEEISKIISDGIRKAYRSFGTADYPMMIKNYYRSYMPSLQSAASEDGKFRRMLHDFFMEEQVRLVVKILSDTEHESALHSLRVFYLNPKIRLQHYDSTRIQNDSQYLATERTPTISFSRISNKETLDRAATKIQSFFKMALIKHYKYLHNADYAKHAQIREQLLKISDLFDLSVTSQLLRNIIKRHDKLPDLYPCSKDFVHVLNCQEFKGTLENVKYDQWLPITRIVVNPKPSETVFAAFQLLVDLPRFTLRVFDNRNHCEMTRLINSVIPNHYEYHPTGYTVFAHGCSDKQRSKEINWAIRIVTIKGEPIFYQLSEQWIPLLNIKPPSLLIKESSAIYVPNVRNCISRWILQTTSGNIISMRLATSYDMVEVTVKVTDEEGNVLINTDGGSTILLPLMILDRLAANQNHRKSGSADVNETFINSVKEKRMYYVEASVRNDSWPLTNVEWTVVNQINDAENIRANVQSKDTISSTSNLLSTREDTKQSTNNNNNILESPYWILQVITDVKNTVEVCVDKRREREIAALLKESRWSEDPSRPERGRKLRESFLNEHIVNNETVFPEENEEESDATEDMTICQSYDKQRRTLKPPEYYRLPTWDLTRYTMKDEIVTDYYVRAKSDRNVSSGLNITDSQKNYSHSSANLIELINEQFRRYVKLLGKREKKFWERRGVVDNAYESRQAYIDTLIYPRAKAQQQKNKRRN